MSNLANFVRCLLVASFALLGGAIAAGGDLFGGLFGPTWEPSYDDDDPRYRAIVDRLWEVMQSLEKGDGTEHDLDLSNLNDGNWTIACVFGGYNDPLEQMPRWKFSARDRERLFELEKRHFPRLNQVEEFELMIVYVDTSREAHMIHFQSGFGARGQHFKKFILKPETVVDLVDGR